MNEEIIAWFKSPKECKAYQKSQMKNNKNSWHNQMRQYSYNTETGVLYKQLTFRWDW